MRDIQDMLWLLKLKSLSQDGMDGIMPLKNKLCYIKRVNKPL